MKRFASVSLLLGAVVLASCGDSADAEAGAASSPVPNGFSVHVTTDPESYVEGEDVEFTVEICNRGAATTTEGGGGSDIPFGYQVLDEGDVVVADDSHAVRTLEIKIVRWAKGQCRTAQASWDQHYWNRAEDLPSEPPEIYGVPQRGDTVPRGKYRVRVNSRQGTATSEPFELQQRD